ncbi:hypothetical protein LWI29_036035 [Acer saccharum]|uniref:Tudor domain-containing protein n=1 Tax=Acer saccharum TaxID=4024 RepID=A0AA39VM21_ACESA|nr:hypothetical protein LWI29_036035 [Acer saccharum]
MSKGHTIPLLHLAHLLLRLPRVAVTVFTTPANRPFISNFLVNTTASIIDLPFPENVAGIPPGIESTDKLPSISLFVPLARATKLMQPDFERAVQDMPRVSFLVSDGFLWWTLESATKFGFPRFVFYGMNNYSSCVSRSVGVNRTLLTGPKSDDELITVTGFPWIKVTRNDFDPIFKNAEPKGPLFELFMDQVIASSNSHGTIVNSFYELEPVFVEHLNREAKPKAWCVGPLCLADPPRAQLQKPTWIQWLDQKLEQGSSVLYVAFGTQAEISLEQLKEISSGLEESNVNFLEEVKCEEQAIKENMGSTSIPCEFSHHVILFPFMSKGHTIPLLHLAHLLLRLPRVAVTVFTTPANRPFISNFLVNTSASIIDLPFPENVAGIPPGIESTDKLPSISLYVPLARATKLMQPDFERAVQDIPRVSFLVSDGFLWWTLESATKFGFPRFVFYGMNNYSSCVSRSVRVNHTLLDGPKSDDELITVTGFPWIKVTRNDFDPVFTDAEPKGPPFELFMDHVIATSNSYGMIVNSFYELEPVFVEHRNREAKPKAWCVGPLCLADPPRIQLQKPTWIQWLDRKLEQGSSVLYVAFGTQADISPEQLKEISSGLEESNVNFLWVIRNKESELGDGFEERVKDRGHTIPLLHLAHLLLRLPRVAVTVFTTPANRPFISNFLVNTSASIIDLPFPENVAGIPPGIESTDKLPSISLYVPLARATKLMQPDFERAVQDMPRVSFLVSDGFLWWTLESATKFGFPRFVFFGMNNYSSCVSRSVRVNRTLLDGPNSDDELITVTGFPWIKVTRNDFDPVFTDAEPKGPPFELFMDQVIATSNSYGMIVNSFYELEPVFFEHRNREAKPKAWCVGPLCLADPPRIQLQKPKWIQWLDRKLEQGSSVLYVAFGTQADISPEQLKEISSGLEESNVNFLWVIRNKESELGDGFEERVKDRGIVVREEGPMTEIVYDRCHPGFTYGIRDQHIDWMVFWETRSRQTEYGDGLSESLISKSSLQKPFLSKGSIDKGIQGKWQRKGINWSRKEKLGLHGEESRKSCGKRKIDMVAKSGISRGKKMRSLSISIDLEVGNSGEKVNTVLINNQEVNGIDYVVEVTSNFVSPAEIVALEAELSVDRSL